MTGGKDIDITAMRIRELEREREDHETEIERIDEQLDELREKVDSQEQVAEAKQTFGEEIITLHNEFQAFATADRLRSSQAFRRRAEEEDISVFEAARKVIAYR